VSEELAEDRGEDASEEGSDAEEEDLEDFELLEDRPEAEGEAEGVDAGVFFFRGDFGFFFGEDTRFFFLCSLSADRVACHLSTVVQQWSNHAAL